MKYIKKYWYLLLIPAALITYYFATANVTKEQTYLKEEVYVEPEPVAEADGIRGELANLRTEYDKVYFDEGETICVFTGEGIEEVEKGSYTFEYEDYKASLEKGVLTDLGNDNVICSDVVKITKEGEVLMYVDGETNNLYTYNLRRKLSRRIEPDIPDYLVEAFESDIELFFNGSYVLINYDNGTFKAYGGSSGRLYKNFEGRYLDSAHNTESFMYFYGDDMDSDNKADKIGFYNFETKKSGYYHIAEGDETVLVDPWFSKDDKVLYISKLGESAYLNSLDIETYTVEKLELGVAENFVSIEKNEGRFLVRLADKVIVGSSTDTLEYDNKHDSVYFDDDAIYFLLGDKLDVITDAERKVYDVPGNITSWLVNDGVMFYTYKRGQGYEADSLVLDILNKEIETEGEEDES